MAYEFEIVVPEYYNVLLKIREEFKKPVLDVEIPDNVQIIDEYWIVPEFLKVQIRKNLDTLQQVYYVIEPHLAEDEFELMTDLYNDLRRILVLREMDTNLESRIEALMKALDELLDEYAIEMRSEFALKILYFLLRDFFGYGPIECFMNDPYLEDISCDGYDIPVYVFHRRYGSLRTNIKFSKEQLDSLVLLLCQKSGKHISYATPLIDATLPDGSRLQATYGTEVTTRGSSFTIRKFRTEPFTPIDLMRFGTMNSAILAYFWLLVENKMSFMVIGETASGKTTTMNALLMFIPPEAKVVSIEDTREIQLYHENWIAGVTRMGIEGQEIDMYDLLRAALRQRPDYIVVGEVRGREAQTLFQAMSTGHASYATLHAGDVNQLVYRLENEPLNVPRVMIQFLDAVIVQFMWVKRGLRKRRAREVNEIFGIDPATKNLLVNPLFKWDPAEDKFVQVNDSRKLEKIAQIMGLDLYEVIEELKKRKEFLELMNSKGIRHYKLVTRFIHEYYRSPEKAFEEVMNFDSSKVQ